jgi:undecaprenyl-diphosphatase
MTLFHAVVLAIVQGLTEFLPVSSTAHLVLFPWLLGWPDGGLPFDVALHVGTLVAILLYFLRTWIELTLNGLGMHYPATATAETVGENRRLFWLLVIGTIPGALAGYKYEQVIENALRKPVPIALAMIVIGVLMWAADRSRNLNRKIGQFTLLDSIFVGIAQALALFPGVSRSGITISAALARKFTREAAARFSFLLSTPLIAGAAVKAMPELLQMRRAGELDISMSTILISIVVSGIVGYAVIALFLRYLQTRNLNIFVAYRIIFGIVVLLLSYFQMGSAR